MKTLFSDTEDTHCHIDVDLSKFHDLEPLGDLDLTDDQIELFHLDVPTRYKYYTGWAKVFYLSNEIVIIPNYMIPSLNHIPLEGIEPYYMNYDNGSVFRKITKPDMFKSSTVKGSVIVASTIDIIPDRSHVILDLNTMKPYLRYSFDNDVRESISLIKRIIKLQEHNRDFLLTNIPIYKLFKFK
jgi:hypothetical protein